MACRSPSSARPSGGVAPPFGLQPRRNHSGPPTGAPRHCSSSATSSTPNCANGSEASSTRASPSKACASAWSSSVWPPSTPGCSARPSIGSATPGSTSPTRSRPSGADDDRAPQHVPASSSSAKVASSVSSSVPNWSRRACAALGRSAAAQYSVRSPAQVDLSSR